MSPRESEQAPRRASAADEAAQWLAILTDAECDPAEREAFVTWLRCSTLHVEEFLRISALTEHLSRWGYWGSETVQELIDRARSASPDAVPLFQDAKSEAEGKSRPEAGIPGMRLGLAACAVLAAAVAALLAFLPGPLGWHEDTYSTARGEMRSIVLPDGSVVDLNTRSSIRLHYGKEARKVELLEGEAKFRVAKDPARPFRVAAHSAEIVALGTTFNVYAQPSRTVVTVLEGRVRVTDSLPAASRVHDAMLPSQRRAVELARGEQAVIAPEGPISRIALADPASVTSWTERRLIFEDTPLSQVAEEFARYSARIIRIEDTVLGARQITGVFDATDPASLVQFLSAHGDIDSRVDESGWILRSSGADRTAAPAAPDRG